MQHFYALYDKDTSLSVLGAPYGTISTVPSGAYPVEVKAIKKIFLLVQYKLPQTPVTASAITLQLPGDVKKEIVAKDGINKLKLFHICGMIHPESTSFDTLSFAPFSKGMDLVMNQPRAGRAGALSDLLHQSLAISREEDIFNIRSSAFTLRHVSKSMTAQMLSGNLTTDEAVSLDNEAHAIDPSVFLPQKNPALDNRKISRDLHIGPRVPWMSSVPIKQRQSLPSLVLARCKIWEILLAFASILILLSWACFLLKALSHFTAGSC
jgi:hypothetical protein